MDQFRCWGQHRGLHTFSLDFLALVEGEVWGQELWAVGVGHGDYCGAEETRR